MSSRVKKKLLSSTAAPPKIEPKTEPTGSRCRNAPTPTASGAMPRAKMEEPKRARRRAARTPIRAGPDPLIEPLALSIKQFCAAHGICVETYFRMQRAGIGPAVMKVGSRTMISVEAAAAWRRERKRRRASSAASASRPRLKLRRNRRPLWRAARRNAVFSGEPEEGTDDGKG